MNSRISDQYINKASATVVALTKILEGASAGFALYQLIRMLAPVIGNISKGAVDLNHLLQTVVKQYGFQNSFLDQYSRIMIGSVALPVIVYGGVFLLIAIGLLLVVIEMIALLTLRFARAGAGFVKAIHLIYMGVCIVHFLLLIYSVVEYLQYRPALVNAANGLKDDLFAFEMTLIIIAVIIFIIILLQLCYHLDIVKAMSTVAYEIETGTRGDFDRTHLSGISFLFAVPYVVLILIVTVGIVNGDVSLTQKTGAAQIQNWISVAVIGILALKQFGICFCYRNLKRAH